MLRKLLVCWPNSATSSAAISRHIQHSDIAEDRFERLVQDIAHLVLEVLRRDKRVEQVLPEHAFQSDNLATGTSDRRVDVECFPEMVDRVWSRLSAYVKQDADTGGYISSSLLTEHSTYFGLRQAPKALKPN